MEENVSGIAYTCQDQKKQKMLALEGRSPMESLQGKGREINP
jgi:hypothetical protein